MENPTAIILSRMITASRTMDVIANNVANASTPGYKALHLKSSAWVNQMDNTQATSTGDTLTYTDAAGTWRDVEPGPIHRTGNPLDLALTGSGYFTVQTSNGPLLTRDGRFSISASGSIVDDAGDNVLDKTGNPITIPTDTGTLSVAADGTISGKNGVIAQIGVVHVADPQTLTAQGANLFSAQMPPTPALHPGIIQGALEGSNVQPITEISRMMQASQNFQMIAQFISAEQTRHQNAISQIISPNG